MLSKRPSRKYTRPEKINKEFVSGGTQNTSPKPKRYWCPFCRTNTPHSVGKCNWCGNWGEEELE